MVMDMKRTMIIGAAGFVGGYLINCLKQECGMEVFATKLQHEKIENSSAQIFDLDIMDKEAIVSFSSKSALTTSSTWPLKVP